MAEEKKIHRRDEEELIAEYKAKIAKLEAKMAEKKLSAEEKEQIRLAKRPLINAVNRIKTLEEVEKWKTALEGLVDFKE